MWISSKSAVPQGFWGSFLSPAAVDERGIRDGFVHRRVVLGWGEEERYFVLLRCRDVLRFSGGIAFPLRGRWIAVRRDG